MLELHGLLLRNLSLLGLLSLGGGGSSLFGGQGRLSLVDGALHASVEPSLCDGLALFADDNKDFHSLFMEADIFSDLVMVE